MVKGGALWALGAMSGTSLDGVDAAMVRTDGVEVFEFGPRKYRAYSDQERSVLRAALGQEAGPEVEAAARVVEQAHLDLLSGFEGVDVVGFHGQTTVHLPDEGRTVQIGDGRLLARGLATPVVWDFRTADMRLGGQGAPLAPFYHFALARKLGFSSPVAFLNIGGVANVTWVEVRAVGPEAEGACLAFDTGPGNALIDDVCHHRLGQSMDEDGRLTRAGMVDDAILDALLSGSAYFAKIPPKSLDRNDFSGWAKAVAGLSDADAVATLAAGTAGAIALGLTHCASPPGKLLVSGGGRKNPGLMEMIAALVPCPVAAVEEVGLDGDMIEAQAFAYLAVRVMRGLPTSAPGTTGVAAPVGGGEVSRPV
ncbi:MAG: anhydro-N-acetylmuramic acid kinase [Silicimonas sp.]|nr:anhydro-N-acetylmuramic acid kinase [Silicimonas sp.]